MSSTKLLPNQEKKYSSLESPMNMTDQENPTKEKNTETWDNRTRFAVYGQAFLLLLAWAMAMGPNIGRRFWNAKRNQETLEALLEDEDTPAQMVHMIKTYVLSYFTNRYVVFFPHIVGALIWWNLYFLQLIPSIRRKHRRFHRILGRVLMVSALCQTVSGVGLAYLGKSSTVKLMSYMLAISIFYCVYYAWYFAKKRDIPKHKYWATRLVGYLQTIALQRFFMVFLMISWHTGFLGLYPAYDENDTATMDKIFEDSFSGCLPTAIMLTEWYLAGYYGWTETETQ